MYNLAKSKNTEVDKRKSEWGQGRVEKRNAQVAERRRNRNDQKIVGDIQNKNKKMWTELQ